MSPLSYQLCLYVSVKLLMDCVPLKFAGGRQGQIEKNGCSHLNLASGKKANNDDGADDEQNEQFAEAGPQKNEEGEEELDHDEDADFEDYVSGIGWRQ